jgi:hypothetical protein
MATPNKKATGKKKTVVRLQTPVFRLSFPALWVPRTPEDGEGQAKYGATAIWTPAKFTPREQGLWKAIIAELHVVAKRDFGKPWNKLPDNIKRGLRDGSAKEGMDGYGEGTRFANMTTFIKPGVVGMEKDDEGKYAPISPDEGNADQIYPGCYCRATVNVWSYGAKGKGKYKGVALGLLNLQKVKDGPRLDNRVAAEDDFDDDLDAEWLDDTGEDDTDGTDDGDDDGDDFG